MNMRFPSLVILLMLQTIPAFAHVRNIQDNFQVVYNVIDGDGNHVSGETVTIKIKKISNGHWYDFNDNTFKSSGWGDKDGALSEDSTDGFYYYTFNPPASETAAEQYQFLVDNASATYGDHQSLTVTYQDLAFSAAAIADAVWDEAQSGHTSAGTFGKYLDVQVSTVGGGSLTESGIADAVWDELLSTHTTAGTSGKLISSINDATDGDQESGSYTGIEKLIRRHGN